VRDLTKAEVLQALAAAEFAAAFLLFLDMMITLDFGRMGIATYQAARDELQRFTKTANAWLYGRGLPTASIAVIERSRTGNFHGHIAMHVPGTLRGEDGKIEGIPYRSQFKAWAREYTDRRFGEHVPRAVNTRGSLGPSMLRHWIAVHYLLKSYDRDAVLVGARNRADHVPLRLGDILAFDYVDPGDVGTEKRLFVSSNLGSGRRLIGVPPSCEHLLPPIPDITQLTVDHASPSSPDRKRSQVKRQPFHAAV